MSIERKQPTVLTVIDEFTDSRDQMVDCVAMAYALLAARAERDAWALEAHERNDDNRLAGTQLAAARVVMREAAMDLESFVNDQYNGPDGVHPAMRRKYDRDMEIVGALRAIVLPALAPEAL